MAKDIFQQSVIPQKPNILREQRVSVYVPKASKNSPGIASFEERDFIINNAHVTLAWPKQMEIERLADPLLNVSNIKVLDDEFENTGEEASIINPVTGVEYKSKTAEVKLKRTGRNATVRPDLIKVTAHDFETRVDENGEIVHTIKVNDAFQEPSLIQIDRNDFKRLDSVVQINWPMAHDASSTINTNGYGLIKIAPNSAQYLKYTDGILGVDDKTMFKKAEGAQVRPTYTGTVSTGFVNRDTYIDANGKAKRNENGNILLAITKDAVGLTNVANRAFSSWQYSEFGDGMKTHFTNEFGLKLDKVTWNNLFNDWAPPTNEERTPQLRFDKLVGMHNAQQEQIDTLKDIKSFLGYFEDYDALSQVYTPNKNLLGCNAYLLSTNSYWAIRQTATGYEWYDTGIAEKKFADYVETDPKRLKPNGEPSVGSSGMWIQSDHVHPTDLTRLSADIYKATNVNIYSEFSELPDDIQDFKFNMWNENAEGIYQPDVKVNIPYVRKSQGIHNWAGSHGTFTDSEESTQKVWVGSLEDYESEAAEIANNSLVFVDDGEDFSVNDFLTDDDVYKAGLLIDKADQSEKIVITDEVSAENLVGSNLTLSVVTRDNGDKAYKLSAKTEKMYTPNKVLVSGSDGLSEASTINPSNIVTADTDLTINALVYATGAKTLRTWATGTTADRLIVTDGNNGVTVMPKPAIDGRFIVAMSDGSVDYSPIIESNVIVTSASTATVMLEQNKLLISGPYNTVSTYNTGDENKMLVANGLGTIKQSTIPANKLLYTSAEGTPAAFAMTAADAGKVVGVSAEGTPTLTAITTPTELPMKTVASAPTSVNAIGTVLIKLDAEPTTMYSGYLYLW